MYFPHRTFVFDVSEIPISFPFLELPFLILFLIKNMKTVMVLMFTDRFRPFSSLPVRLRSPLRRRPDAATWLVARDVSQWAEPEIRPLGHAVFAFIAERTRRLSTLLTGDMPPQHLMRPVHSAGR